MTNLLMGYSKNQKVAKDFLRWITSKNVYRRWFDTQQGYSVGATTIWEDDPLWKKDPVMLPFRAAARAGRFPGYAGPADRKAAEGLSKYLQSGARHIGRGRSQMGRRGIQEDPRRVTARAPVLAKTKTRHKLARIV